MGTQRRQRGIPAGDVDVVQQDAHPHAAAGGLEQPGREIAAGGIGVPDV